MKKDTTTSRGQSEVLGVVLLLAIVIVSLGVLGVFGANNFETSTTGIDLEIAEHEMSTLASEIETVATGQTPVRTVSLEFDAAGSLGTTIVDETQGTITVDVGDEEVYSGNLGVIEYENAGVRIAYQGGGVWRQNPDGDSFAVLEPTLRIGNRSNLTLSFPLIVVHGIEGLSKRTEISFVEMNRVYPSIHIPDGEPLVITIESRYYQSWDRYFTESLGINPDDTSQDQKNSRIVIELGGFKEKFLHMTAYRVDITNS